MGRSAMGLASQTSSNRVHVRGYREPRASSGRGEKVPASGSCNRHVPEALFPTTGPTAQPAWPRHAPSRTGTSPAYVPGPQLY